MTILRCHECGKRCFRKVQTFDHADCDCGEFVDIDDYSDACDEIDRLREELYKHITNEVNLSELIELQKFRIEQLQKRRKRE